MKIHMKWTNEGWLVTFGIKEIISAKFSKNYRKAFFWVKWQEDIDAEFVLDYIHNR